MNAENNVTEIDLEKGVISFKVPMFMALTVFASVTAGFSGWVVAKINELQSFGPAILTNQNAIKEATTTLEKISNKLGDVSSDVKVNSARLNDHLKSAKSSSDASD